MGKDHADRYRALSPEEKAQVLKKRFPRVRSKIETLMSDFLSGRGESFVSNDWQSLEIEGKMVPREADLKIDLGTSKVVVECDGEAWHGPGRIFGDPDFHIRDDELTARAYLAEGYSVLRYSETEIHSGVAFVHLSSTLERLRSGGCRVLRLWHPSVEEWR